MEKCLHIRSSSNNPFYLSFFSIFLPNFSNSSHMRIESLDLEKIWIMEWRLLGEKEATESLANSEIFKVALLFKFFLVPSKIRSN